MKMAWFSAVLLAVAAVTGAARAEDAPKEPSTADLQDETDILSYTIGYQIGKSLVDLPIELHDKAFFAAIDDVLKGRELAMEESEIMQHMQELQKKLVEAQQQKASVEGAANLESGAAFLEANAKKEGVTATDSGLQYRVITEGAGKSPGATDEVTVHYRGTLLDGTQFDSSYDRGEPATFKLNQVIKGWTEGLQLMKEGGKYEFFIPSDLAYGPSGRPSIPPNSVLKFEVELITVNV